MAVEHVDIVDGERHEPKGAGSASAQEVYRADGAGSGAWEAIDVVASMAIGHTTNNAVATTAVALDTYYALAGSWTEITANNITTTVGSGKFTVVTGFEGTYRATAALSFIMSRNSDIACFSIFKNGAYVAGTGRIRRKVGTGSDVGAVGYECLIPSLVAGDEIQLAVQLITGDGANTAGDTLTVENGIFTLELVKAD